MSQKVSQQQIGQRIAKLRKMRGLSQEELAKNIKVSRPSLVQIELGRRGINVLELQEILSIVGYSFDDFMAEEFPLKVEIVLPQEECAQELTERVFVPILQVNKFKNILLYILERCGGKPNVGETLLYKLLYFADFNHYELYEEHLTGSKYRKLHYGPVPVGFDSIIKQMIEERTLQKVKVPYHGHTQTRYLALKKADLTILKASEVQVIDKVIDQMSGWTAKVISDFSHKDIPWSASKQGEEINYELVFYREAPFSVRAYEDQTDDF